MSGITSAVEVETPAIISTGIRAAEQAALLAPSLHQPGVRDAHRALLHAARAALEAALHERATGEHIATFGAERTPRPAWTAACRERLLGVYQALAEDARYGAGQLSRSAQRAPSQADCEDGWRRVEQIVRLAEHVAGSAQGLITEQDAPPLRKLVSDAQRAARLARAIVDGRNPAYTFHANPAFSFGEGWYAAAAAVLSGVTLQIEPEQKHSAAAERFLVAAGLGAQLQPYRSRPRANKALPWLIADAFRSDPAASRARLRAAFLFDSEVAPRVQEWLLARLGEPPARPTVLVWNRQCRHGPQRNSTPEELSALCHLAAEVGLCPILIGDGLGPAQLPLGTLDLALFWKEPLFQGLDMRRAQLALFEHLREAWNLVAQVGVTTAGMDGPALLGMPTLYITDQPNVRLGRWVGAVPGYEEVVRDAAYQERITSRLAAWAGARSDAAKVSLA